MASNIKPVSNINILDEVLVIGLLQRFSHLKVLVVQILDVLAVNSRVQLL
jgi:hypothetical protein